MTHRLFLNALIIIGLGCVLLAPASCARFSARKGADSPLRLTIQLPKAQFLPGEVVKAEVALLNPTGQPVEVPMLDHTTLSFSFAPKAKGGDKELRYIEPVFSPKEPSAAPIALAPGTCLQRTFLFTKLTFERGAFVLQPIYSIPESGTTKPARRTYAKAVAFSVAGAKVFAHRTLDGLLTQDDAIALARREIKTKPKHAEAMLVTDEKGFPKWWVNLELAGPGAKGGSVKSYFIDPIQAKVWREAKPFTRTPPSEPPKNSKLMQEFRDRQTQKRNDTR